MDLRFESLSWGDMVGWLALEVSLLVAAGTCIALGSRNPLVQRATWQSMMLGLFAIFLVEAFAIGGPTPGREVSPIVAQRVKPSEIPQRANALSVVANPATPSPTQMAASADQSPTLQIQYRHQNGSGDTGWPLWIWLLGTGAVLSRLIIGHLLLALRLRRCDAVPPGCLLDRIETIRTACHVPRRPRYKICHHLQGPIVHGLRSETLVLPRNFQETFTPPQQAAILAHEFAHLENRDARWRLLADVTVALWWWHPGAWWVRRRWRLSSEMAADGAVVYLKDGPAALAESLVALGRSMAMGVGTRGIGMLGHGAKSDLAKRVHRLIELQEDATRKPTVAHRGILASALACFAALGIVQGPWPWVTARAERPLLVARLQSPLLPATETHSIDSTLPREELRDARRLLERGELLAVSTLLKNIPDAHPDHAVALRWLHRLELLRCHTPEASQTIEAREFDSVSANQGRFLRAQLEAITIPSLPPAGFETLGHALGRLLGAIVLSDAKDENLVGLHLFTTTSPGGSSILVRPWMEDPNPHTALKILDKILAEVASGLHYTYKAEDWGILIMTAPDSTPWLGRKWTQRDTASLELPYPPRFNEHREISGSTARTNGVIEPVFGQSADMDASQLRMVRASLDVQQPQSFSAVKLRATILPQIQRLMEQGEPEMAKFLLEGVLRMVPSDPEALRLKQQLGLVGNTPGTGIPATEQRPRKN